MQEKHSGSEDELDFRALIRSLLRAKWWIIGLTVVAAVLGFVVSQRGAVKTYEAQAMIVFGQSPLNVNVLSSTQPNVNPGTSALPDSKGITDLATLDDIFATVYQSPDLAAVNSEGLTQTDIKRESSASVSGTNQLMLRVTDPDPARATLLANLWARTVADRLNSLYGYSNAQIVSLQQQAKDAQQNWETAEKALVDYLPQSRVDGLSAQLSQAQAAYNTELAKTQSIDLILSDARALSARLAAQQASAPARPGDALGILELQQRASDVLVCNTQAAPPGNQLTSQNQVSSSALQVTSGNQAPYCLPSTAMQFQFTGADTLGGLGTVADAQQDLNLLTNSLEDQQKQLKSGTDQTNTQLALLHSQLEAAQFEVDKLQTQRDLAKTAFGALSAQISSAQAQVAANGLVARVVGKAGSASQVPSNVLLSTVMAGASGFILAIVLIWLRDWWRSDSEKS